MIILGQNVSDTSMTIIMVTYKNSKSVHIQLYKQIIFIVAPCILI